MQLPGPGMLSVWTAVAVLAPVSGRAGIEVLSQDREVSVDIDVTEDFFASCIALLDPLCQPDSTTTTNFSDVVTAPDASPFLAAANDPAFPASFASQDSEIEANAIRASGGHAATATWSNTGGFPITFHSEMHDVESRAIVSFELDAETLYTLSGSVTTGGAIFSVSSARIRLTGPGGVIEEVQVDSDPNCVDPGCFTVGPAPIATAGSLLAGTYTLEAMASGTASGVHSTSGSFGTGVDGAFDVELLLQSAKVPSLGHAGLLLLSLSVGSAGHRRLRIG